MLNKPKRPCNKSQFVKINNTCIFGTNLLHIYTDLIDAWYVFAHRLWLLSDKLTHSHLIKSLNHDILIQFDVNVMCP